MHLLRFKNASADQIMSLLVTATRLGGSDIVAISQMTV